jgi:hypothetical protein
VDPFLVGDVLQDVDGELVVGRFGQLHVELDRLVFRGDHETDRADEFCVRQLPVLRQPREGRPEFRHDVLLSFRWCGRNGFRCANMV